MRYKLVSGLTILPFGCVAVWAIVWLFCPNRISMPEVEITWTYGGVPPSCLSVIVIDQTGTPIPDVLVDGRSNSGWSGNKTPTNNDGRVTFCISESDLISLSTNRHVLFEEWDFLGGYGRINAGSGLNVMVVVKNSDLISGANVE